MSFYILRIATTYYFLWVIKKDKELIVEIVVKIVMILILIVILNVEIVIAIVI
jgi:hypothetical protein